MVLLTVKNRSVDLVHFVLLLYVKKILFIYLFNHTPKSILITTAFPFQMPMPNNI